MEYCWSVFSVHFRRIDGTYAAWWRNHISISTFFWFKLAILLQAVHFPSTRSFRRWLHISYFVLVRGARTPTNEEINKIFYCMMWQAYKRRHLTDTCNMHIYDYIFIFISFPSSWMWMSFGIPFITNMQPIHRGEHMNIENLFIYMYFSCANSHASIYMSRRQENWFCNTQYQSVRNEWLCRRENCA